MRERGDQFYILAAFAFLILTVGFILWRRLGMDRIFGLIVWCLQKVIGLVKEKHQAETIIYNNATETFRHEEL